MDPRTYDDIVVVQRTRSAETSPVSSLKNVEGLLPNCRLQARARNFPLPVYDEKSCSRKKLMKKAYLISYPKHVSNGQFGKLKEGRKRVFQEQ
jgi:hypothetical protein